MQLRASKPELELGQSLTKEIESHRLPTLTHGQNIPDLPSTKSNPDPAKISLGELSPSGGITPHKGKFEF